MAENKTDCAALLSSVQRAESRLPESSDAYFGHPPPPQLYVTHVSPGVSLCAAATKRCVSAQLFQNDSPVNEPMDILCLEPPYARIEPDEVEEVITCACLVSVDPALKSNDDGKTAYAAIAIGTNKSRILSVEVEIRKGSVLSLPAGPFEPLSLDPPDTDLPDDASVISDTSRHSKKSMAESSQHDGSQHAKRQQDAAQKPTRFRPTGGVTSISLYNMDGHGLVWVAYEDGTAVRIHHAALLSTIVHDERYRDMLANAALRLRVALPPSTGERLTVVPLPKYHPSPLAPLAPWKPPLDDSLESPSSSIAPSDDEEDDESEEVLPDFYEALVYGGASGTGIGDALPALCFYTSENQFIGCITGEASRGRTGSANQDGSVVDHVIGGLVKGVFGTAMGVVKWGLGQGEKTQEEGGVDQSGDVSILEPGEGEEQSQPFVSPMFYALHVEQSTLYAGLEIHDAPRQITSVSVDPEGNLAATTDTLGRVLLIDLCTKQVVRMWKGVREASCAWIEIPRTNVEHEWQKQKNLYLVIHSRQRRSLEIYRTRHGPRVKSMQVGRDAQLVQSSEYHESLGSIACCYILHSSDPGTALNEMELLIFDDIGKPKTQPVDIPMSPPSRSSPSKDESAMRLQLLQQLLAKTNVPSQTDDVFQAFTQITSLKDLCTALDVLAVASELEEAMGVIGAEFHFKAISHCRQTIEHIVEESGRESLENAQVKQLASRITYHAQIGEAYDKLHDFERKCFAEDEQDEGLAPRSAWAVEAMAWLTMHETVTGSSVDESVIPQTRTVLPFWMFAKACSDSKQTVPLAESLDYVKHKIHLSDSTRSRKEVLVHIFKPLLRDIFAFSVVGAIFISLGIDDDIDYLLKCFGDWFVSIPAREAARKGLFGMHSPMIKWLQGMVVSELDSRSDSVEKPVLLALHKFCCEATDLVRAFLLATLCREAVSIATKKKEAKTYGKISSAQAVEPWDVLLRKLRVCLLVSLRLNGMNLGPFPITVKNVEAKDMFSVYEWLARDELAMSHKHEEIVSLEAACKVSGLVFDPSSPEGDSPGRWKMLQQACLAAAISEEEKEEYLLDMNDDDQLGALLLYLSKHNNPALLVAHRALLLAKKWVEKPNDLRTLTNCLDALQGLSDDEQYRSLSTAIRFEVWHSAIRPFYRAALFGFDDVHELTEDIAGPLLDNRAWLVGLGKIALPVLNMLTETKWDDTMNRFEIKPPTEDTSWPPVREDFILKRMVESSRPMNMRALDTHRVVVCGIIVSEDMETLSAGVPDLYECFLPASLFQPMASGVGSTEKQMEFLEQSVIDHANELEGEVFLGKIFLGEIETLAELWEVDLKDIRTLFLLAMYELGKDQMVDELLSTCSSADLDVERFVSEGLGIACRRLNRAINLKRSSKMRSIMGMLDADTCEWLREQAETSLSLLEGDDGDSRVELSDTHMLILRLLSLCSMSGDKDMAGKIHSLSILSGTLLKSLEQS